MSKWKMVRLGEVLDYEQPTKYIVESTDYNDCYCTPVLTAGQTFILGYTDESDNVFKDNLPVIIFDDFTTAIKYVNFPFKVKSSAMKILKAKKEIAHIKYLFYCMSIIKVDTQLHKRYWISKYTNIEIPLPPIEEQKRIADILDKASSLIDLRKQQLEKMDLLIKSKFIDMFGEPVTNPKGWEVKKIENVIKNIRYGTSIPPVFSYSGFMFIRATNIKKGKITKYDMKYISAQEAIKIDKCKVYGGELLIVRSGVNTGDTCVITKDYEKQYAGYDLIVEMDKTFINSIFINELLNTRYMEVFIKPLTRRAAQPHINSDQIKSLQIMVPPIELQNDFASFVEQVEKQKTVMQLSLEKMEMNYNALMQEYFG